MICFYWVQIGSDGGSGDGFSLVATVTVHFSLSGWIMEGFFLFVCFKYYAWPAGPATRATQDGAQLVAQIIAIYLGDHTW